MPLLGAHMSIAGGLHLAFDRIRAIDGEVLQIFSRNERRWQVPFITDEDLILFSRKWKETGPIPVAVHDTYLTNLASTDEEKEEKSIDAFADELRRTAALGAQYLIAHPGSHLGAGIETGLERLVRNLDRAVCLSGASGVTVLLETTAGQGYSLGSRFEEIAFILEKSRYRHRLGVCFDTCHVFAAGYDIRTPSAYERTFHDFDRIIGLTKLKFFHLNDSKRDFGSRVDRHEHIGRGRIGVEAFRMLLNDPRFHGHPMVIETPKEGGMEKDMENLHLLRSLVS